MSYKDNGNIILVGFMATGKSSVGREVARRLDKNFIDTDELIVNNYYKSIDEIFKSVGESVFRERERNTILSLSDVKNTVISTGGGSVCYKDNQKILSNLGVVISLIASYKTVLERVKEDTRKRPLLALKGDNSDTVNFLLQKRAYYYIKSDLIINTDSLSVGQVASHICEVMNAKNFSSKN